MKKKYDQKVKQYTLDGALITTFQNAREASKSFGNYDSIISCCKGKYKTADGYIWRFENDEFSLESKRDTDKNNITCKICNSQESVRSMAMHLKWAHDVKTEEYVEKYEEFRPKVLKQNQIKSISEYSCKICNIPMMHNQQLMYHITKKHPELSQEEYIVKYECNEIHPTCKCGCGGKTEFLKHQKDDKGNKTYFRKYIMGHWDWIKPGYFSHTDENKEKIRKASKERVEYEKQQYGKQKIHLTESLLKRFKNNWNKIAERIKNQYNVECTNIDYNTSMKKQIDYNFRCLKCGYEWVQISMYPNCQKCNPPSYIGSSLEEKEVYEYIKSIYQGDILFNNRQILDGYEIDIYLPDLKIGIEYNGLYWHSEKCNKGKDYHINKLKEAKNHNIKLIQIFSDEWLNKQSIVKSKLQHIINQTNNCNKIYARKCEIKEISNINEKTTFLNNNHIQGTCKSPINIGLYDDNELVAIMTFNKPRLAIGKQKINIIDSYELVRYATSKHIIGGASKLLKHFIKKHQPKYIYSYSDNRWSDWENNMYLKIGFKFKHISPPNYFYTLNFKEKHHRFNFNKFKLKEMGYDTENKTEYEIMSEIGYTRIWDAGSSKFEMFI